MKDKNVAAAEEAKRKSDALKAANKAAGFKD